jgi:hypothetical protein
MDFLFKISVSAILIYSGIKYLAKTTKTLSTDDKYGASMPDTAWIWEKIFGKHYARISYYISGITALIMGIILLIYTLGGY